MAMPPQVFRQFFDDAGVPLAGGLLHTYVTGTTTLLDTYSDAALTTENANPIVLDDSGRCDLYLAAPPTAYRFRLEDSDGGLVDEQDDIVGMTAPLAGDFVPLEGDVTMTGLFTLSGNATANLNPTTLQQVNSLIAASADTLTDAITDGSPPIGSITAWLQGSVPTGYLALEGAAVSRDTYADLFALWGTTYGVGDGSTTFDLPDVRGRFLRAWDNGAGIDAGRTLGSEQDDEFEAHTHALSANLVSEGYGGSGVGGSTSGSDGPVPATDSAGGAAETRPINFSVRYIVKAL